MAEKKAGGLYLSIGLTLSQLQSDFLAAEQTIKSGIAQLNRQQNIVRLRMEADTAGLDRVKDATKILETQERGLNQLLDMQRDKLTLATKAYQDVAKSKGANSAAAKQLETSMERERVAVARLEAQLKSLSAQKISINTSQLQSTISENIARINAKIEHIKVKTDIDVSKLGAAASEFDKAKAHVQGLNRELDLQNKKLLELKNALRNSISTNGLNNVKTINLQTEIQKQIQAINQLKAKITELNNIPPPKTNKLLSNYLNIKGDVTGALNNIATAFSNLQSATSSADNAIVASLSVIGSIPHPVGRAVAAFAAMPIVLKGVENSLVDMARAATAAGDATYVMSRGFQMSVADTGKFTTMCKTAGVEVNDLASTLKRVQQTIIRGGDDAKAEQWLRRYGESAFDASGRLKDLNEMTLTLSRALKKAQADGRGMEFILATMRGASADAITAIEDAEDVYKQAATTVKNGLLDPKLAHEVRGKINQMNDQAAKMNATFSAALLPVANEIVPRLTERMGKLTQIIADNKEMIRSFGRAAADAFLKVEQAAETVGKAFLSVGKAYYDWQKNPRQDAIIEKYKGNTDIKTVDDLIKAEQPKAYNVIKANPFLYQQTLSIYEPMFRALQDVQDEVKRRNEELAKLLKQPLSGADLSTIGQERRAIEQNPELLDTLRKARKYQEEADAILYKMNHSDYENKKLDVDIWYNELAREGEKSNEELEALAKLRSAKLAQIQKEQLEKTQQYYKEAADTEYRLTHTAFEKQLRDIEQWKEAKIKAGEDAAAVMANAAAKEAEAFESAMDRIRGKLQSLEDKIFAIDHSQYENDLRRIQQEYLREAKELQDLGLFTPERKAQLDYLYNRQKQNLDAKAAKGGDYTKPPEGALQRGGNGIMVIGGDQLIDDGKINQSIGVLVDDSREFAQQLQGLSEDGRKLAIANRQLAESQRALAQASQQATSGFQLIEGDKFVNQPATSQSPQPQGSYQVIGGDQVAEVQQFSDAIQQAQNPLQAFTDSTASAKSALAEAANSFSPDYFKHLAEDTKALSEMQYRLNKSTENLITAQDKLATALNNLPTTEDATRRTGQNQSPDDGMMKLSYRGDDSRYRPYSDIPQQPIAQKNSGFKAGFDWDVFGGAGMTAIAGLETLVAIGTIAPHPALKGLGLLAAGGLGLAKGSYDATTEASNQPAQQKPFAEADLSGLITPVTNIDKNVQSIFTAMQDKQPATLAESFSPEIFSPLSNLDAPISGVLQAIKDAQSYQTDSLRELFGTLPNIEANTGDILRTLQERGEVPTTDLRTAVDTSTLPTDTSAVDYLTPLTAIDGKLQGVITELQAKEVTVSFETVVTPLNNISGLVEKVLAAMGNRQPPNITVSPNISVNLGGAYVFDNAMKRELVDDCTQQIVDNVEQAVRQATSNSSYGYGA